MKEKLHAQYSQSTHSKDPIFMMHMDILTNFRLGGEKYSNLIEELAPKIMRSNPLKSTKLINGRLQNSLMEG